MGGGGDENGGNTTNGRSLRELAQIVPFMCACYGLPRIAVLTLLTLLSFEPLAGSRAQHETKVARGGLSVRPISSVRSCRSCSLPSLLAPSSLVHLSTCPDHRDRGVAFYYNEPTPPARARASIGNPAGRERRAHHGEARA